MEFREAVDKSREMLKEYCPDYSFDVNGAKNRCGLCNYRKKTIELSEHFIKLNDWPIVKNTLLHEIAHALTKGEGHNYVWKAKCEELGMVNVKRLNTRAQMPRGNIIYQCINCDNQFNLHKRIKRKRACTVCCNKYANGRYSELYIFKEVKTLADYKYEMESEK